MWSCYIIIISWGVADSVKVEVFIGWNIAEGIGTKKCPTYCFSEVLYIL